MSHFKYEINERNLRLQIRENKVPLNEDAWLKFENYSATQKNFQQENVMNRFKLSFNRNLVLPIVFGSVIALFSLLLFNFVNIKNPNPDTTIVKSEPTPIVTPATEQNMASFQSPVKKESSPVKIKDSLNVKPQQIVNEVLPETANVAPVPEKPVIRIQKNNEIVDAVSTKTELNPELYNADKNVAVNPTNAQEVPKPKKKHKRQLIVTEPTIEEETQTPPPVSQTSSNSTEEVQ